MTNREELQTRINNYENARQRSDAKFLRLIEPLRAELEQLDEPATTPDPPVHLIDLPAPSTASEAPSLEDAPALQRHVPTPEVLALTDAADVITALGGLETAREEHELLSAWTVAGNRAALNAIAVHVGGPLADRAARALKRLQQSDPLESA